jgi:hypothetical protein
MTAGVGPPGENQPVDAEEPAFSPRRSALEGRTALEAHIVRAELTRFSLEAEHRNWRNGTTSGSSDRPRALSDTIRSP